MLIPNRTSTESSTERFCFKVRSCYHMCGGEHAESPRHGVTALVHYSTMRTTLAGIILLIAANAPALAADQPLLEKPEVSAGIRVFEAWMNEQVAYRGLPGVAVGVVHD